jgi:hypothetical protein
MSPTHFKSFVILCQKLLDQYETKHGEIPQEAAPKKSDSEGATSQGFHFEGECFDGSTVYLAQGRWESHILFEHADMQGYENQVQSTALDPDVIVDEGIRRHKVHASYGHGQGKYRNKWIWVPLRFVEEGLWVVRTAHWVDELNFNATDLTWRKMR